MIYENGESRMKWKNKGHELDQAAEKIMDMFRKDKRIYVFGAGALGQNAGRILGHLGMFAGYIDNDPVKQCKGVGGSKVISFSEYRKSGYQNQIVIAADRKNSHSINRQLSDAGFVFGKDYFYHETFFNNILPVALVYCRDLAYVNLAQICLTERCSLKCERCAHGCYNVSSTAEDMAFKKVMESADSLFEKVDLCGEFVLIGGEPLLYKRLADTIAYIGKKYRNKMVLFSITTNGSIMPSDDILELCKKYDVMFKISNYSLQVPWLEERYTALATMLDANHVQYYLEKPDLEWMDYGFETVNRDCDEAGLVKVFDECRTPCREIRGNKLYFCVMARSVSENLGMGIDQDDYLDMDTLTSEDYKKILLEFNMGYSDKGYLEMCRHCNGAEAYRHPIPAAKQKIV